MTAHARHRTPQAFTPEEERRILALLADGCGYREAGATVGRDANVLRRRYPGYGVSAAEAMSIRRMFEEFERL